LLVNLSLDGVTPAPDDIYILPGEIIDMYVISDSDGVCYEKDVYTYEPFTISNVHTYPAAGDLADARYLQVAECYRLEAYDSADNVLAGKHFGFDLTVDPCTQSGIWESIWLERGAVPDDTVRVHVIPEPATVFLFALGSAILIRKKR